LFPLDGQKITVDNLLLHLKGTGFEEESAKKAVLLLDVNSDGIISFAEYLKGRIAFNELLKGSGEKPAAPSLPKYITDPDSVFEGDYELRQQPNYANVDRTYLAEKTNKHVEGSLPWIVHQLVRALEKEASHKLKPDQWKTIVKDKFRWSTNGGKEFTAEEVAANGSYNLLIGDSPFYQASKETWKTSHDLFHTAFPTGFAWEALEVFSGPPKVAFTWRHWGHHKGEFYGHAPTNKVVELIGACIVDASPDLKVEKVQFFFDSKDFFKALYAGEKVSEHEPGVTAAVCPFLHGGHASFDLSVLKV